MILVLTDDQGYGDVGVHGNETINTPHIDRFAREGVALTRFYCSPVCAPTRASLMTGRYYYRTGVIHTSRGGAKMWGDEVTIAEHFAKAGYATGIFGKWHLGDNYPMRPQDQGFAHSLIHKSGGINQTPDKPNSYFDPKLWRNGTATKGDGYCTDVFFREAIRFIEGHREQPFFVYLPTNAPHTPLEVDEKYVKPFRQAGLNETTARVYGMIRNIDENLGKLLRKLDELELRENTIVLFIGDNGPQQQRFNAGLRGRKSSTYEGGIRVPCFVQWPQGYPGGRKLETIAAHIDVLPTLLEACDVEPLPSANRDGRSLHGLLTGKGEPPGERKLFFQCHRGLTPKRYQNCAVVTQKYKLVGYPGTFSNESLDTSDEPKLELYDVSRDPGEEKNIAASRPNVVEKLRTAYDRWFDDVRGARQFTPGLIEIDPRHEDPLTLCRYQDGNYRNGTPHGWTVKVAREARFRVQVDVGDAEPRGMVVVEWQGKQVRGPVTGQNEWPVVTLEKGKGVIDIWFEAEGKKRVVVKDNSTVGNVTLKAAQK